MTNIQSAARNIVSVALADIRPSSYNPRKTFDETSLAELAESIRQQGVLQPVGVRPIEENRYEVIFGERRYRASLMAGLETIPAVIYEVTDEVAEEMAVTENLQRKDVTPIEEANAYQKLIESGRHDVHSLAVQFGKSEDYIRTRLKFTTLIPEIANLLETDEITISVASEICRYGEDIQREVYERHLKDNGYNSWRGMKAADVARRIEQDFTTDLNRYFFDKTLCKSCPHNTNNMMLFCEGACGKCANRKCLEDMNASYLRCWPNTRPLHSVVIHIVPTKQLSAALWNSATRWRPCRTAIRHIPSNPKLLTQRITRPQRNTRKRKGTTSRSRRSIRRNVRTSCAEAKRAKSHSMSLSGAATFPLAMWRLRQ